MKHFWKIINIYKITTLHQPQPHVARATRSSHIATPLAGESINISIHCIEIGQYLSTRHGLKKRVCFCNESLLNSSIHSNKNFNFKRWKTCLCYLCLNALLILVLNCLDLIKLDGECDLCLTHSIETTYSSLKWNEIS